MSSAVPSTGVARGEWANSRKGRFANLLRPQRESSRSGGKRFSVRQKPYVVTIARCPRRPKSTLADQSERGFITIVATDAVMEIVHKKVEWQTLAENRCYAFANCVKFGRFRVVPLVARAALSQASKNASGRISPFPSVRLRSRRLKVRAPPGTLI